MKIKGGTLILSGALVLVVAFAVYLIVQNMSLNSQVTSLNSQATDLNTQLSKANMNINGKADVFDAKLHDLLQEHTFLLINTIRRSLDSSASYSASLVALQNNINEVGAILTPIYGNNASQLVALWNTKTNIFINYSNSIKNSDPTATTTFNAAAATYEQSAATFWASTNNPYPTFDFTTMKQLVTTHMNNVKTAVDYWNAKDYTNYFIALETAYNAQGSYADVIAQGIITQHPEDF
jgi:hypothetical protein